jgi:hypothetical protein
MAKLGPESLRRISIIQPYSGDLPSHKNLEGSAWSWAMEPMRQLIGNKP